MRVQLRDPAEQRLLQDAGVDQLLLPVSAASLHGAQGLSKRADRVVWDVPFILIGPDWEETRQLVRQFYDLGFVITSYSIHYTKLYDMNPDFPSIRIPTLYVWSDQDSAIGPAGAHATAKLSARSLRSPRSKADGQNSTSRVRNNFV